MSFFENLAEAILIGKDFKSRQILIRLKKFKDSKIEIDFEKCLL